MIKFIKCFLTHHDFKEPCEKLNMNTENIFVNFYKIKCNRCGEWVNHAIPYTSGEIMDNQIEELKKCSQLQGDVNETLRMEKFTQPHPDWLAIEKYLPPPGLNVPIYPNEKPSQGWQCPICKNVYAPSMPFCTTNHKESL